MKEELNDKTYLVHTFEGQKGFILSTKIQRVVCISNDLSSFRMEGNTIYQWIEKLMPLFNGEQLLGDITEGLTAQYRNRVYELGETLYKRMALFEMLAKIGRMNKTQKS